MRDDFSEDVKRNVAARVRLPLLKPDVLRAYERAADGSIEGS